MLRLKVTDGDLLEQRDCDAIVNAWNRNFPWWFLIVPHGVAGAIRKRAGARPFHEIGYAPMRIGEARVTSAGRLPFKAIIHVPGIDWHRTATDAIVREGAHGAVQAAMAHGYKSVALPILGSGVGGMKVERALSLMKEGIYRIQSPDDIEVRIVRYAPKTPDV